MTHEYVTFRADGVDSHALEAALVERVVARGGEVALYQPSVQPISIRDVLDELPDYVDAISVRVDVRNQNLPIGNALWNRVKYLFHEMVVIYTNQLAGRQHEVNQRVLLALELLAEAQQAQLAERDARLARLTFELDQLKRSAGQQDPRH